jgi:hypothetical protein
MHSLSEQLLGKGCELGLPLRVRARDDETEPLVEHTDVALSVEIELAVDRLRVHDP